jgi:uncharacterized protein YqgC (DUF456 family)
LTTLFCCLPLGIVSIVKASQVSGLWASDEAKKWAMWSAIAGVVVGVAYLLIFVIGGAASFNGS